VTAPVGGIPLNAVAHAQSPQAKLQEAAHQLESVFYGQLFQAMRQTIPEGSLIPRDSGEQMFTSMLDDQVARAASQQTERGLATAIYHELARSLPAAPAQTTNSATSPASTLKPLVDSTQSTGIPLGQTPIPIKPND
jgi:Rod binding domain-containing protein